MNYQTMSTGEKRSVTNSLKKFGALFLEQLKGDFLQFDSKEQFVDEFYSYWVKESKKSKTAWVKTTDYSTSVEFKNEMLTRIYELFSEEISVFEKRPAVLEKVTVKTLPSLRSKKKRLRKKREKQLQLLNA